MKSAITPHTQTLFELFYGCLSDADAEVASNAAYAAGLIVQHSEVDLSPQYLPLLGALRPLFEVAPDAPGVKLSAKDNAAGAVARLIIRNTAALPLDQVLPIFMNAIPCKEDPMENRPVFRCIFHLFRTNSNVLVPYMDHLLQVFATVLDPNGPDQVGDAVRTELIQLIVALNAQDPAKIQAAGLGVWV